MDHYAALGVSPNAGNAELNNAFKRKYNSLKPAQNNNMTRRHTLLRNSSKARQNLKNSYNLLKNKGRRNEYNKTRKVASSIEDYKIISQKIRPRDHFGIESYHDLSPQQELEGIGKDLATFAKTISEELKKGYSPIGTPFYSSTPYNIYQTLIKDNKNLSEMIILPVISDDKLDTRIFPLINDNILKKGFRPYESPIMMRPIHHMRGSTVYNFQVFIK